MPKRTTRRNVRERFRHYRVTDLWQISTEHERQSAVWLLGKTGSSERRRCADRGFGKPGSRFCARLGDTVCGREPLHAGIGEPLRKALKGKLRPTPAERDLINRTYF